MKLPSEKELRQFDKWGAARPTHEEHGIHDTKDKPISEQLIQAKCWDWHMVGNELHCMTDYGPLMQRMPVNVICVGEKDGLPILKEI